MWQVKRETDKDIVRRRQRDKTETEKDRRNTGRKIERDVR